MCAGAQLHQLTQVGLSSRIGVYPGVGRSVSGPSGSSWTQYRSDEEISSPGNNQEAVSHRQSSSSKVGHREACKLPFCLTLLHLLRSKRSLSVYSSRLIQCSSWTLTYCFQSSLWVFLVRDPRCCSWLFIKKTIKNLKKLSRGSRSWKHYVLHATTTMCFIPFISLHMCTHIWECLYNIQYDLMLMLNSYCGIVLYC